MQSSLWTSMFWVEGRIIIKLKIVETFLIFQWLLINYVCVFLTFLYIFLHSYISLWLLSFQSPDLPAARIGTFPSEFLLFFIFLKMSFVWGNIWWQTFFIIGMFLWSMVGSNLELVELNICEWWWMLCRSWLTQ